ncbi:CLAVATA3/ESR (CLE)-related protein 41-like [Durio zibethinus]|uniref:CLAVATA3/ESR (CLE)-related protein 41-like n=1 Tax=Durio zibethinus TaxID=66656 RepID=A0A6P6A4S1_DURZI|nr:CLAVATA3/ESR (CLE)-related protein 41-like [Durio zibethinus]
MDIEPLWALGGWLFLFLDCMAAPKSPSTASETYAKSHSLLLFLTLFFIFLLLLNPTTNPIAMNSSNVTPSIPFRRLLLDTSSSKSTSSATNLHPKQTQNVHTSSSSSSSSKSSRRQFGAEAHEVPSGPNPISNR